jgi:hypothetical protein
LPTNQQPDQSSVAPHPFPLIIIEQGSNARFAWVDIAIRASELTVTPELAARLLERYPSLALHACKSRAGASTFGERLTGALLPHALEHLTIELLVQAHPGCLFAGNTRWLEREERTMRVRIAAPQGISALNVIETFSEALLQLNEMLALSKGQTG